MIEITDEIELTDDQLENISGGCATSGVSLGGLHLGFGHHFGHFGGHFGAPVVVEQAVPVQVQYQAVVAQPAGATAVQATSCGLTLAAGC